MSVCGSRKPASRHSPREQERVAAVDRHAAGVGPDAGLADDDVGAELAGGDAAAHQKLTGAGGGDAGDLLLLDELAVDAGAAQAGFGEMQLQPGGIGAGLGHDLAAEQRGEAGAAAQLAAVEAAFLAAHVEEEKLAGEVAEGDDGAARGGGLGWRRAGGRERDVAGCRVPGRAQVASGCHAGPAARRGGGCGHGGRRGRGGGVHRRSRRRRRSRFPSARGCWRAWH
jgi:hypothetical protein